MAFIQAPNEVFSTTFCKEMDWLHFLHMIERLFKDSKLRAELEDDVEMV